MFALLGHGVWGKGVRGEPGDAAGVASHTRGPDLTNQGGEGHVEIAVEAASDWSGVVAENFYGECGVITEGYPYKPGGPWRTVEQVEVATLEYLDWFNHRRLFQACGDIPPAELEHAYHRHHTALAEAGQTTR